MADIEALQAEVDQLNAAIREVTVAKDEALAEFRANLLALNAARDEADSALRAAKRLAGMTDTEKAALRPELEAVG